MNNNILLIEGIHPQANKLFEQQAFQVKTLPSSASRKELIQSGCYTALGIRSRTELTSDFFDQAGNLLSVGAFCIGINQIDLQTATKKGVAVFNSPYSNTRSVAELTLANIINLSRKITQLNQLAHLGKWKKTISILLRGARESAGHCRIRTYRKPGEHIGRSFGHESLLL